MSDLNYLCPQCRAALASVSKGDFDTWECKQGHGAGLTVTEAYGHFQDDEIHAIWQAAKSAPKSSLKSPLLGLPMVAITIVADDDEVEGNEGTGAHPVTLDVAPDEQFLWFHVVDLSAMPADLPSPPPSAEQLAKIEQLRAQSREAIQRDADARENPESRVGYRMGSAIMARLHLDRFVKKTSSAARDRLNEK